MAKSVLIVDDEEDLVASVEYALEKDGLCPLRALTGRDALEIALLGTPPDLMILDRMLPDMRGTDLCKRLRAENCRIPVLMLTAKGEEADRIVGFEAGADDYVVKPFSLRELVLRVQALLRRADGLVDGARVLSFGPLRVDRDAQRVWTDGVEQVFTALEFRLLCEFLTRKGSVLTRDHLLDRVWGSQSEVTVRTVDTYVMRIRQKLGMVGPWIETLRGAGYRFREQASGGT